MNVVDLSFAHACTWGCLNALSHLFARPGEQCDIHQISADALAESLFALNLIGDFWWWGGQCGHFGDFEFGPRVDSAIEARRSL